MATYYVSFANGVDTNNGNSTGTAWKTLQKAADTAVAGDKVLFQAGTEVLTSTVDLDTNSGVTSAFIEFVGVNSSWVEDGTRHIIDGNNAVSNLIWISGGRKFVLFRNFDFRRATGHGINASTYANNDYFHFYYCRFANNGSTGIITSDTRLNQPKYFGCVFENNGSHGVQFSAGEFNFCTSRNNGGSGYYSYARDVNGHTVFYNCISNHNTGRAFLFDGYNSSGWAMYNCVGDGNGLDGFDVTNSSTAVATVIGCRFTRSLRYGVKVAANARVVLGYSYFPATTTGERWNLSGAYNGSVHNLLASGADTNVTNGTDTSGGYVNPISATTGNYNLADTATRRRIAVDIP